MSHRTSSITSICCPTCENLVRHFWVRASIYDKNAAKQDMDEKILIDPSLAGKSREETGLELFVDPENRSSIMGIPMFISQAVISYVMRRVSEGNFKDGLDNNKKSHWNDTANETMFNNKKKGFYSNLSQTIIGALGVLALLHQEGENKCVQVHIQAHGQDPERKSVEQQNLDSIWEIDFRNFISGRDSEGLGTH